MEDLIGGGFRLCVVGVGTTELNLDEFPSCDVDCGQAAERVSVLFLQEVRSQGLYDFRRYGKLGQGDSLDVRLRAWVRGVVPLTSLWTVQSWMG